MAATTKEILYVVRGVDTSARQVQRLTDAMGQLERKGPGVGASARAAAQGLNQIAPAARATEVATGAAMQRLAGSNASIDPLRASLASLAVEFGQTTRAALVNSTAMTTQATAQERALAASNAMLLGLGAGAVILAGYAGTLITVGDAYTSLQGKINVYATSAANAAEVEERLYAVAREARTNIQGVVSLYSRLSPAFTDMGRSQAEAARFTELVSKAQTAQGATARETEASTIQLSQALASGVLRGDEFRSMMESSPGLMRQIAAGFETVGGKVGVPVGALRAMAEEGELTADKVIAAIFRMDGEIERLFSKAPKTVGQALTVLQNEIGRAVGMELTGSGTQEQMAETLLRIADAADEIVQAVTTATQAALALGIALGGSRLAAAVQTFVATQRAALAAAEAITAMGAAQRAQQAALGASTLQAASVTMQSLASNAVLVGAGAVQGARGLGTLTAAAQAANTQMLVMPRVLSSVGSQFGTVTNLATQAGFAVNTVARAAAKTAPEFALAGGTAMTAMGTVSASATRAAQSMGTLTVASAATTQGLVASSAAAGALTVSMAPATAATSALATAKGVATTALLGFRTVAGSVIAFMGGPWGAGILAAIGVLYLYKQATDETVAAQRGQRDMMNSFAPIVTEYQRQMERAAGASGMVRDAALQAAGALRQQAAEMVRGAELRLVQARARARETERKIEDSQSSTAAGGAGFVFTGALRQQLQQERAAVAEAEAALEESVRQFQETGGAAVRMPRTGELVVWTPQRPAANTPTASPGTSTPAVPSSTQVDASQAEARAAAAAADAETDANNKLVLSLREVREWREAQADAIARQYADDPESKARAMAALEQEAAARERKAQNEFAADMRRAAERDRREAASDQAARDRDARRQQRERGYRDQAVTDAELAETQTSRAEQRSLEGTLERLEIQRQAERDEAEMRITDRTLLNQTLEAIDREYEAKRERARQDHVDRMQRIDRGLEDAAQRERDATRSGARAQLGQDLRKAEERALDAFAAADPVKAREAVADVNRIYEQMRELRREQARDEEAAADRRLERDLEDLRKAGASEAQLAERRRQHASERVRIEQEAARDISDINKGLVDNISRLMGQAEEARRKQTEELERLRQNVEDAAEEGVDRLERAILEGDWEDLGRDLGNIVLRTMWEELVRNPVSEWIRQFIRDLFKRPSADGAQAGAGDFLDSIWGVISGSGRGNTGAGGGAGGGGGWSGLMPFAKGGAFDRYGVVNQPTLFMSGSGRPNIMGEENPEAVMPLARGPGGSLGVRMFGGGGGKAPVLVDARMTWNIDATGADPAQLQRLQGRLNELEAEMPRTIENVVQGAINDSRIG